MNTIFIRVNSHRQRNLIKKMITDRELIFYRYKDIMRDTGKGIVGVTATELEKLQVRRLKYTIARNPEELIPCFGFGGIKP